MDDGLFRPSHDTGCIVAGAVFFATFFCCQKKVYSTNSKSTNTPKFYTTIRKQITKSFEQNFAGSFDAASNSQKQDLER